MARGSVLFYSGSVYHGGGANRSDATRIGLNITYNVAWLRQEENQYLSVPREVAATLPTELLRLMGYDRGAYALGYIDDLRDPIEAVRPGLGSTGFGVSGCSGPAPADPAVRLRRRSRPPCCGTDDGCFRHVLPSRDASRCIPGAISRFQGGTTTVGGVPVEIQEAKADDYDELFAAFSRIVGAGEGFPQLHPVSTRGLRRLLDRPLLRRSRWPASVAI